MESTEWPGEVMTRRLTPPSSSTSWPSASLRTPFAGRRALEEGASVLGDGDLGVEDLAGPLEVAGVVGVVVGDGGDGDLRLLGGGEIATEHPAVAVEGLAGVDGEHLVAADEVDVRGDGAHGALVGNLDGADAGRDLHGLPRRRWWRAGERVARRRGAPGRSRTCGQTFRRRLLCPLSYGGPKPL